MAVPVVVCGRTTGIASGVKAGLAPEYEMIHLVMNTSDGTAQLPYVLAGKPPPEDTRNAEADTVATNNYTAAPQALILGGGYSDQDVQLLREACGHLANSVPWLRADLSIETPPAEDKRAYGMAMVSRVKVALGRILQESEKKGDIVWY